MLHKSFLKSFFITTALSFTLTIPAWAQSIKTITLKDGSVIKGEIAQLADDVYTIKTSDLGEVRVPEPNVMSIVAEGTPAQDTTNASLKGQVQEIQTSLLSDPEIMKEMQSIMEAPEIRGVLSDPAFMNAIMSYDPDKIQQNEKTQYLLKNPKFQSLMEKIRQKIPSHNEPHQE